MKTNSLKLPLIIVLAAISAAVSAQTDKQQKTCINIEEITNGKVVKIDTCFVGMTENEIRKQLSALGVDDIKDMNINMDSLKLDATANEIANASSEILIVNDDKGENSGDEKVKIIANKNGKSNTVIINGNGYAYSTTDEDSNTASAKTEIIVKSGDNKDENAKIFVLKKIEVHDLSDSEKSHNAIPSQTNSFSGLKIYPNPAASSITISYHSSSPEPLNIKVYDENGKTVYTEQISETGENVNQSISLSNLSTGIYFVNLSQGTQNETKKIIIK